MKKINFRNKLLLTIIPIIVLAIGVQATISYRMASENITTEQRANMEQIVQRISAELDTWVASRERDAAQIYFLSHFFTLDSSIRYVQI